MTTAVITVKAQNFHFGIKTGINLSKETKTEVERQVQDFDKEFRKGFHIGGIVTYSINKKMGIRRKPHVFATRIQRTSIFNKKQ